LPNRQLIMLCSARTNRRRSRYERDACPMRRRAAIRAPIRQRGEPIDPYRGLRQSASSSSSRRSGMRGCQPPGTGRCITAQGKVSGSRRFYVMIRGAAWSPEHPRPRAICPSGAPRAEAFCGRAASGIWRSLVTACALLDTVSAHRAHQRTIRAAFADSTFLAMPPFPKDPCFDPRYSPASHWPR
jgi:hypothetical protein